MPKTRRDRERDQTRLAGQRAGHSRFVVREVLHGAEARADRPQPPGRRTRTQNELDALLEGDQNAPQGRGGRVRRPELFFCLDHGCDVVRLQGGAMVVYWCAEVHGDVSLEDVVEDSAGERWCYEHSFALTELDRCTAAHGRVFEEDVDVFAL